jgi:hypothetical protein
VGSPRRLWRLDDAQYGATLATLFGGRSRLANEDLKPPAGLALPLGVSSAGSERFSTTSADRRVAPDDAEDLARAAYDVAGRLLADPMVAPCVAGTGALAVCLERPVLQKAELLFRRPVVVADVAHYLAAAASAEPTAGRREAARLAFQALLVSPRFVFRAEQGDARGRLDAFEVADAISYGLTDGPADHALWTDAQSGALLDDAAIAGHVARLLATAEKRAPARKLVRELFGYRRTLFVKKTAPFHRPEALVKEADLFVEAVLRDSSRASFFAELLRRRSGFATPATATSYDTALTGAATATQPVMFAGQRQGLLGHPAWLSGYSLPERTDPIVRGRFVYERLLCGTVPNVPIDDLPEIPEDPMRTLRERLALHTQNPSCRVCHSLMDDIGLGLEGFDHFGRSRSMEAGRPVDVGGILPGDGGAGRFEGLSGLVDKLLASEKVADCLTVQAFRFFMGRLEGAQDECALRRARARYQAAGGDLVALVQGFFLSERFLRRTP